MCQYSNHTVILKLKYRAGSHKEPSKGRKERETSGLWNVMTSQNMIKNLNFSFYTRAYVPSITGCSLSLSK